MRTYIADRNTLKKIDQGVGDLVIRPLFAYFGIGLAYVVIRAMVFANIMRSVPDFTGAMIALVFVSFVVGMVAYGFSRIRSISRLPGRTLRRSCYAFHGVLWFVLLLFFAFLEIGLQTGPENPTVSP